jgi:hypothetical protein
MPSPRTRQPKRHNLTAHNRAVADPRIKKLVVALHRRWDLIGPIERGDRLCKLVQQGCSPRGLEEDIGHSATTIRRHMALAALPDKEREAVKAGHSAKKILARKADADRRRKMLRRLAEDQKTGKWSDRLADAILEFCRTKVGFPQPNIRESDFSTFLSEVRNALGRLEAAGVKGIKMSVRLDLRQRFERTCPRNDIDEFAMAQRARWLATFLLAEASERPIRELGIEKAINRQAELRVPMTTMANYQTRLARYIRLDDIANNLPTRKKFVRAAINPRFRFPRPGSSALSDV